MQIIRPIICPNKPFYHPKELFGCFCDLPDSVALGRVINIIMKTDELLNPRPTQPKKTLVNSGIWASFSPRKVIFFVGWD